MTAPGTSRDIVGLDARAVRASVQVVSQAGAADLARRTPCADWTLAGLLAHMTAQHNGFAAAAAGDGADLVRWQTGAPAADPVGGYAVAAERVLAALAAADVLSREFALPQISRQLRFPAAEAIEFHFVDYVVHGWDVARDAGANGRPVLARSRRGRGRGSLAGTAAWRAGTPAAAGREPAADLPFRAQDPGRIAPGLHLSRRGGHARPAGREGRRGARRGQDRQARPRCDHYRG